MYLKRQLLQNVLYHWRRGVPRILQRGDAHFWLTYPLPRLWIRIWIRIKILSWVRIRIRIKAMRIHSPGLSYLFTSQFTRTVLLSACSILEIKKPVFLYNDMWQKIIMSQVNKLAFFSCCPLVTTLSGWRGGGCTWPGGGCTGGGGGMHVHPVHPPWVLLQKHVDPDPQHCNTRAALCRG